MILSAEEAERALLFATAAALIATEGPAKQKPQTCRLCGQQGHNRLRCPVRPEASAAERAERSARRAAARAAGLGWGGSKASPASARRGKTSQFRGVSFREEMVLGAGGAATRPPVGPGEVVPYRQAGPWRAQVWDADAERTRFVGHFADEEAAARAHDAALLALRGRSPATAALLNFPPPPTATAAPLPLTGDAMAAAAAEAILRAWEGGAARLRVDFLLPDEEDAPGPGDAALAPTPPGGGAGPKPFTAAESAGVAGTTPTARFATARALAEATLRLVKADRRLQGRLAMAWVDRNDLCCEWVGDRLAAVLSPTPDALPRLRALADADPARPLIVFNPAWGEPAAPGAGRANVVSDFGLGRAAREGEAWAATFTPAAVLARARVKGRELRLFHAAGGPWQTHAVWPNGRGAALVGTDEARPSYARLAELAATVPGVRRGWAGLLDGGKQAAAQAGGGGGSGSGGAGAGGGAGGGLPAGWEASALPSALPPPPPVPNTRYRRPRAATAEKAAPEERASAAAPAAPAAPAAEPAAPPPSAGADEDDDPTGAWQPAARDVRMDPVMAVARWLGSGGEGGGPGGRKAAGARASPPRPWE